MNINNIQIKTSNWTNSLKGIIRAGIYLSLLTPILVSNKFFFPFVGPKSIYFMAIAEIVFFCWVVLAIFDKESRPKINILTISLVIFLIIITLSGIFGINPSNSFWSKHERITGLLMMYHLFGLFLATSSTFKTKKDWMQLFSASIGMGIVISLLSFKPEILNISYQSSRGGATLGNSSFLGSYLIFNFFFALFNLINSKKNWKILYGACMAFFLYTMFYQQARAATLSSIGGLLLIGLLWLGFVSKNKIFKFGARIIMIASILVAIIGAMLMFQKDGFVQKMMIKHTVSSRLITLNSSWQAFKAKPLLGWGWENYDSIWAKYYDPSSPTKEFGGEYWYDKAHNVIAETAATSGILGLLSYVGVFIIIGVVLVRKYFKENDFWVGAIFISLIVAYLVQNLTVFDMVSSYIMLFLTLAFLSTITGGKEIIKKDIHNNYRLILSVIIVICAIASIIYFVINPLKSSAYIGKTSSLIAKMGESATTTQQKIAEYYAQRLPYYKAVLLTSSLGKFQNRDFLARETISLSKTKIIENVSPNDFLEEVDFIIAELEKNAKESPYDIRSLMNLSQLYSLKAIFFGGSFDKAQEAIDKSLAISPNNQQALWNASQVALFQQKPEKAIEYVTKSIEVDKDLEESYNMYVRIALISKKIDLAQEMMEKAIKYINKPEFEKNIRSIFDQYTKQ